jgi:response regulator RpfG family c-di-GMP phosphodiesterase
MAAFFHDIFMDSYIIKNEVRFIKAMKLNMQNNKKEISIIKNHPTDVRLALMDWHDCPPEVINIVLHHHELPNGDGFPDGLKANQIDELTACFIMAEELVELYLNKKAKGLVLKYFELMDSEYRKEPFKPFYQIIVNWLTNKNLAL